MLVSPLSGRQMARRAGPGMESVLEVLSRIVDFEQAMLLDETVESRVETYDEWFDRMMEVRQRALERLGAIESGTEDWSGFQRYRVVLEHEYRCNETILEAVLSGGKAYRTPQERQLPRGRGPADPGYMVRFAGGTVEIGSVEDDAVWPEERPVHAVRLPPFWIDAIPVTNADYLTFVGAGGYSDRDFWSIDGWAWLQESVSTMPANWIHVRGSCRSRWLGRQLALDPSSPVSQVSAYEAEAFAAFVGKRLPTELEWEAAAAWDPELQTRRKYPWGNMPPTPHVANLDQFALAPAPIGAFPGNISPLGCYGMIGDIWEWTSSAFLPYDPHAAADLPIGRFDAKARVLRGGSWATRPGAIRVSTRRASMPGARHLFAGFRCARDA